MKYKEDYIGTKQEYMAFLTETFGKLLKNNLDVDGQAAEIPEDKELSYKLKYENDDFEGQLSIKVTWVNAEREEEHVEEEE